MSTTKRQMYTIIASAIKKFYNRHGMYTYPHHEVTIANAVVDTMTVVLSGKSVPSMVMTLSPPLHDGKLTESDVNLCSTEYTLVEVMSYNHRGEMITKINDAITNKSLVGEIKLVSERTSPIRVIMKMKLVGKKISSRKVSINVIQTTSSPGDDGFMDEDDVNDE